jgi:hypothetical protein
MPQDDPQSAAACDAKSAEYNAEMAKPEPDEAVLKQLRAEGRELMEKCMSGH